MANLEELVVQLVAETSGLRAELDKAAKATENATAKMDDAIKSFTDNSKKNVNFFQTSLATMTGFLGSDIVKGAFNGLKSVAESFIESLIKGGQAAMEEESALKLLANSMALTGQYSAGAIKSLEAFAGKMESLTGVQDNVVLSNLALLSSITKLDSEGLQRAQKAAIDLSAALGKDLGTTTQLIAKGIEGNTEAFQKLGIRVEESATKAGRLENIMKALKSTEDAAQGSTDTFAGALLKLKNAHENVTEERAKSITQNPVIIAGMKALTDIFDKMTEAAKENGDELQHTVAEAFQTIIELASVLVKSLNFLINSFMAVYNAARLIFDAIFDVGEALMKVQGLAADTGKNFEATGESWDRLMGSFDNNVLDSVGETLDKVGNASSEAFAKLGNGAAAATPSVKIAAEAVKELSDIEKLRAENLKAFTQEQIKAGVDTQKQYEMDLEFAKINLENKTISEGEYFARKTELLAAQQEREYAMLNESYAKGQLSADAYYIALANMEKKQKLDSEKLQLEKDKKREENLKSSLDTISTLQNSSNKELAAVGKAAAIYQATIDGYAAVQKALASAPPPFNFAIAAAVGVATAANISKIAGTGLAKGIDSVPGFGNKDNFPAVLQPGERVVQTEANQDLTDFLAKQKDMVSQPQNIVIQLSFKDEMIEFIEAKILERQKIGVSLLSGAT